jgi:hypothetical protein
LLLFCGGLDISNLLYSLSFFLYFRKKRPVPKNVIKNVQEMGPGPIFVVLGKFQFFG